MALDLNLIAETFIIGLVVGVIFTLIIFSYNTIKDMFLSRKIKKTIQKIEQEKSLSHEDAVKLFASMPNVGEFAKKRKLIEAKHKDMKSYVAELNKTKEAIIDGRQGQATQPSGSNQQPSEAGKRIPAEGNATGSPDNNIKPAVVQPVADAGSDGTNIIPGKPDSRTENTESRSGQDKTGNQFRDGLSGTRRRIQRIE